MDLFCFFFLSFFLLYSIFVVVYSNMVNECGALDVEPQKEWKKRREDMRMRVDDERKRELVTRIEPFSRELSVVSPCWLFAAYTKRGIWDTKQH